MARFILFATKCRFENGVRGFLLTDIGGLGQKNIDVSNDQLDRAISDYSAEIGAAYGGSYFISERLAQGVRAPRGYRDRKRFPGITVNREEQVQ